MYQCAKCGKRVTSHGMWPHFRETHPEYKFSKKRVTTDDGKRAYTEYRCDLDGSVITGYVALLRHYKLYHQDGLAGASADTHSAGEPTNRPLIDADNVTTNHLDQLLEQVDKNMQLLEQEKQKTKELRDKCVQYCTRIVELQTLLAQEHNRR